jgi:hypothetical protein
LFDAGSDSWVNTSTPVLALRDDDDDAHSLLACLLLGVGERSKSKPFYTSLVVLLLLPRRVVSSPVATLRQTRGWRAIPFLSVCFLCAAPLCSLQHRGSLVPIVRVVTVSLRFLISVCICLWLCGFGRMAAAAQEGASTEGMACWQHI